MLFEDGSEEQSIPMCILEALMMVCVSLVTRPPQAAIKNLGRPGDEARYVCGWHSFSHSRATDTIYLVIVLYVTFLDEAQTLLSNYCKWSQSRYSLFWDSVAMKHKLLFIFIPLW